MIIMANLNAAYFVPGSVPSVLHRLLHLILIITHERGKSGETGTERLCNSSKVKQLVSGEPRVILTPKSELFTKMPPWLQIPGFGFASYSLLVVGENGEIMASLPPQTLNLLCRYNNITLLLLHGVRGTKGETGKHLGCNGQYQGLPVLL